MRFKFNAKRIFLTYPKCTLSKDRVLELLQEKYPIKTYCIALEAHEDGSPHIHAVLFFDRKVHRDNERAFDIEGFHPNIQTIKNASDQSRILKYVKKDGDFLCNHVDELSRREQIALQILDEGLTPKVVKTHPSLLFCNYSQIKNWLVFMDRYSGEERPKFSDSKRIHYWISGPSNSGKTTWLRALLLTWDGVEIPQNNDYGLVSSKTNLLYADEYRGFLTVQQLNRLADGFTTLNTKGGSFFLDRAVVVILSNFTMKEVYHNLSDSIFETLTNRFVEYVSNTFIPFPKYNIKINLKK